MATSRAHIIDKSMHKAYDWIYTLEDNMGFGEFEECNEKLLVSLLKVTLHELRDNLPLNNLAHFSAQLPIFIRGLLFEGWNPEHTPLRERQKSHFLQEIFRKLPRKHQDAIGDMENAVRAVFSTIREKIDSQEVDKLAKVLPRGITELLA